MPLKKSPTVYDVAEHAGVSIATVSRVLRGPEKVAAGTRERVLSAVQELGYVPNASARGLAGRRTGVLGLLIPGHDIPATSSRPTDVDGEVEFLEDHDDSHAGPLRNRYFEQLVQGAEAAAWRDGYALLIAAGTSVSRDVVLRDLTGRVDGLAVVSRTVPDDLIERAARSVPLVLVAGEIRGATDSVRVDNRGGMSALTRHILTVKPPGPVVYLAGPPNSPDATARELGFRDAVASHDGPWHRVLADFSWQGGYDALGEQLRSGAPGAVIGANDQSALGALAALQEAGIRVPEQCVVTGFDGIDEARYSRPRLTTVRQPMTDLGIRAVEALLRRIADPDAEPLDLQLPVDVLLRDSSGRAAPAT
ncbi:LacI family DNA-binding transcriptional regulator [Brachybacterium sp. GCM10030267]|uniref:LacI family DNA-binding transcriptional regulator n=1 Tax=unclassified Brachybacterium TaxID=2623841 RepID=UPI00360AC67C